MSGQGVLDLVETLDALRFPLHGSRLIEASAGTGKTYTIAALYVRLVLGHGGANAYARALTPPEILVVTFTDAATQELRDRIRRRLANTFQVMANRLGMDGGKNGTGHGGQVRAGVWKGILAPGRWNPRVITACHKFRPPDLIRHQPR